MTTKPKRKLMTYYPATETTPEYVTDGKTNYYACTPIRMPPATHEIHPYTGPESVTVRRASELLERFNDPNLPETSGCVSADHQETPPT